MISIQGKLKTDSRFKGFDYKNGVFVVNLIHETLWNAEQSEHVQILVDTMNRDNPDYIFRLKKRS